MKKTVLFFVCFALPFLASASPITLSTSTVQSQAEYNAVTVISLLGGNFVFAFNKNTQQYLGRNGGLDSGNVNLNSGGNWTTSPLSSASGFPAFDSSFSLRLFEQNGSGDCYAVHTYAACMGDNLQYVDLSFPAAAPPVATTTIANFNDFVSVWGVMLFFSFVIIALLGGFLSLF